MRHYSLVLYQLSGIQAGIQARHAGVELGLKYDSCNYGKSNGESFVQQMKNVENRKAKHLYNKRAKEEKTVIVLNGGTTTTMEQHIKDLERMGVVYSVFNEPDLGNLVTAINFISDGEDRLLNNFTSKFKLHV